MKPGDSEATSLQTCTRPKLKKTKVTQVPYIICQPFITLTQAETKWMFTNKMVMKQHNYKLHLAETKQTPGEAALGVPVDDTTGATEPFRT